VADQPPNIVFVITDQQRFDTIAALGASHVDTPNLDRLVAEGTAFTRCYATSPSCAPSRASLFTGLSPHTTGVLRNEDTWRTSWVSRLRDSGYRTVNVGKMHASPWETELGFDERVVVENKDRDHPMVPFLHDELDKALFIRGERRQVRSLYRTRADYGERLGAFEYGIAEDLHPDVFVGLHARWWLDSYPGDEPFFLEVGFPGPHPPYDPVPRHYAAYSDREVPTPIRSPEDLAAQPEPLRELRRHHQANDHDSVVTLEDPSAEQSARQRRHYLANVTMIDEQIGLILEALEHRGVLDDTVIVFCSDHGDTLGDHGHVQKWTMYEGSIHVPAIVWGPGRVARGRVDALVSLFDLGPTVLELARCEVPPWMEARSLLPALRGEPFAGREIVFAEHARDAILTGTELMTMAFDGRYKLVEFIDCEEGQLFDLREDPGELRSLWDAEEPSARAARARLHHAIVDWRTRTPLQTRDRLLPLR
jgi:arylsulfatase